MAKSGTALSDFFVAGGTLRHDAPSYVRRPADVELPRLVAAGQLCYVLTTRQMGKSSLMTRTARQLREAGINTAVIDLTSIGTAPIDEWYLSFLDDLQSQLSLTTDAESWWAAQSALSPVKRFTNYIRDVVLVEVSGQVALFIDEVDSALNLPFSDDFFAAVRAVHNQSLTTAAAGRLAIVLLGVAAPHDLIKEQHRTPFNVGQRIELEELALSEAQPVLAAGLPGQEPALVERIFYWTEGHPYLTQKIGQAMVRAGRDHWSEQDVDELVAQLFFTERARTEESNLQFVNGRITASPHKEALLRLYRQVHQGRKKIKNDERSPLQTELKLYGLVKATDKGHLVVRNRIYRRVFNKSWWQPQMANTTRQWLWPALVAITLVSLALTVYFYRQSTRTGELLAQTYRSSFEATENPTLRLDNLARLMALPGYEAEAVALFHDLPLADQVTLFTDAPADLQPQVERVVVAVYGSLVADDINERSESTQLLTAMATTLRRFDRLEQPTLIAEIDSWLDGRSAALHGNYEAARLAYSVALSLNQENPAVRYERALTALSLADDEAALADLVILVTGNAGWSEQAAQLIGRYERLHPVITAGDEQLAVLVAFVPTKVPTPTSTVAATVSPTPPTGATAAALDNGRTPSADLATEPQPTPMSDASPIAVPAVLIESSLTVPHTPASGRIVYTCFVDGIDQICTINADGTDQRQLTVAETTSWYGSFAPDRQTIVFSSLRAGLFAIYGMTATGDEVQRLSPPGSGGDYAPAYSADGSRIAFTRAENGRQNIWVMNRDGSHAIPLTDIDGDALDPVWSPDGQQIAFARRRAGEESFTHVIMDVDGRTVRELTLPLAQVGGRSDWSPDGRWLAIYAGPSPARDIYLVAVDGTELYRLTDGGDNLAPAFSPDGHWLVFTSARSGHNELYLIRLDGMDLTRLTVSDTANWQPRWGK